MRAQAGERAAAPEAPEVAVPGDARLVQLESDARALGRGDDAARLAAFEHLTTLEAEDLPAVRARLATLSRGRPPQNWVDDILPRFSRRGQIEGEASDLARGALAELAQQHARASERAHVAKLAETLFLWRGLQRLGTLDAARAALPILALDEGAWMPEGRAWVRRAGPRVMAAALGARTDPDRHVRGWARWAIEELGADNPGRAVHALEEDDLADVLLAYAGLRMQSAMRVVISYVGSDRRRVRRAAREALALYGGNAIWVLRTAYRNHAGEAAPPAWGWRQISTALYAHLDAARAASIRAALEAGIAARGAGDHATMEARFDEVLASAVELEDPAPVAEGYAELAAARTAGGRAVAARTALRRALRLAPTHPRAQAWRDALEASEAEELRARGFLDVPRDAATQRATAPTARPDPARPAQDRSRFFLAAGALALLGVALLALRRRGRGARPTARARKTTDEPTFDEAESTWVDSTQPG